MNERGNPRLVELQPTQTINGDVLALASFSYESLMLVYQSCMERVQKAQDESEIVGIYLDHMYPRGENGGSDG